MLDDGEIHAVTDTYELRGACLILTREARDKVIHYFLFELLLDRIILFRLFFLSLIFMFGIRSQPP